MSTNTKIDEAIEAFRKAGGILTMSEAIQSGVHLRQLYALRDSGQLEVISQGLYRLIEMQGAGCKGPGVHNCISARGRACITA